jgi:hypothetical protein
MLPDGPLRRDIHRVLDFRASTKISEYKPQTVDQRQLFAASLYEITSEHASSICLLLLFARLSSACALLRSCIESAVRSTWLLLVATEENVQNIAVERGKDKGWPGLEQMIGAIEAHHKAGGLLRRIFTQTGSLNDFTHGGVMQISQRMAPYIEQDIGSIANRMCLRNAVNALALVTCAFHLGANDYAGIATVIKSGFEVFSSFEAAGDNDNS